MKKTITFLLSTLLLIACGGGDDGGGGGGSEYLNVNNNNSILNIGSDKTSETMVVKASPGCEWEITWDKSQTWIQSITPVKSRGDKDVTITVSPNTTLKENSTVLTISSTNSNIPARTVTLRQLAGSASLSLGSQLTTFSGDGGTQQFAVKSNTTWQVSGFNDWCHADGATTGDGDGTVTVRVDANSTEAERHINLVVNATGIAPIQVEVHQEAPTTLGNSGDAMKNVAATAGTCEFNVVGTARWTASVSQITGSWARIMEPTNEVQGNGTIRIAFDDNTTRQEREVEITCNWSRSTTSPVTVRMVQAAGTPPTVTTPVVSDVDRTVATLTASYESMFPVRRYGFCYSTTSQTPDLSDSNTIVSFNGNVLSGAITTKLNNLEAGLRYYVRAFAQSDVDITYSDVHSFNTSGEEPADEDNPKPQPK